MARTSSSPNLEMFFHGIRRESSFFPYGVVPVRIASTNWSVVHDCDGRRLGAGPRMPPVTPARLGPWHSRQFIQLAMYLPYATVVSRGTDGTDSGGGSLMDGNMFAPAIATPRNVRCSRG